MRQHRGALYLLLLVGIIVGTIGWLATLAGSGDLIPPSGMGWLEVAGFVLVIPTAIFLHRTKQK